MIDAWKNANVLFMEQRPSFPRAMSLYAGLINTNAIPPIINNQTPSIPNPVKTPITEPPKPPPQPSPSKTNNPAAIRTMKSDLDRLFQTAPPSIAQRITRPGAVNPAVKQAHKNAAVYVILGVMLVLFIIAGAGAYYFWDTLFPPPPPIERIKPVPPAPLFATESSRTIDIPQTDRQQFIKLMADSMKEFERNGTMKRILVKLSDASGEHFITLSDFFEFYHITPPESLIKRLDANPMIFVHTASSGTRLGFAVKTNDASRTLRDMLDWEADMRTDFNPLFFGIKLAPVSLTFEDRSYHNIDWRYLKLSSETDIGIGYGIFPAKNMLIIGTSKELMETVISRLFDAK